MKRTAIMALSFVPLLALGSVALPETAEAKEVVYHGFSKDKFYVARGGTPPSIELLANSPLLVFRSTTAYSYFKAHMGSYLGRPVTSDADFKEIMLTRVKLVDCVGTINTAGINNAGDVRYSKRGCYSNSKFGVEKLIELELDDGRKVIIGSIWCINPVKGEVPEMAKLKLEPRKVVAKKAPRWKIEPGSSAVVYSPITVYNQSFYIPGCSTCCPPVFVSGSAMQLPNTVNYSTPSRMVIVDDDSGN